jgi:hypothetical protein
MRTGDGLGMDWTRSGWTTGGLHVDSHRIPGGVKYTEQIEQRDKSKNESKTQLTVVLFLEKLLSPKMA